MVIKTSIDVSAPSRDMENYQNRLESFVNWEGKLSASEIARAGFYYSGVEDIVVCYGCQLQLKSWEITDIPSEQHKKFEIECSVASKLNRCNIEWMNCDKTMYPKFESTRARKSSFSKHPTFSSARRKEFVKLGFFYSKMHDCAICYHCGLGLKNWSLEEDPLEIHFRFFPYCPLIKGKMTKPIWSNWDFITQLKSITVEERAEIELNLSCAA